MNKTKLYKIENRLFLLKKMLKRKVPMERIKKSKNYINNEEGC